MPHHQVSIITATHNDGKYLKKAIKSVLTQTYPHFEFIIIDDASNDDTREILKEAARRDKRIIVITNHENLGLSASLNNGIKKARGIYIARIDSDDEWLQADKLEKQVAFLNNNPDYGLVGSWAYTIDQKGNALSKLQYPTEDSHIRPYFLFENCFVHSSVLFRSSCIGNGYDNVYKYAQDYDFWLSICTKTKVANIPEFMVAYRKNPGGLSQRHYKDQIRETIQIIKSHKHSYPYTFLNLLLWYSRLYLPQILREQISKSVRMILFHNTLQSKPFLLHEK